MELAHSRDVLGRESANPRLGLLTVSPQILESAFAPAVRFDFAADVFAHLLVEGDDFSIHRLVGSLSCGLNELEDFFKRAGLGQIGYLSNHW